MLSHAWPIILVLVLVFGGGIVRSILKAVFGGLSAAAGEALAQLPEAVAETTQRTQNAVTNSNADAVRRAIEIAVERRAAASAENPQSVLPQGLPPELEAIYEAAAAAQQAARKAAATRPERQQPAAHHKSAKSAAPSAANDGRYLAPLPALKKNRPLPPLAARKALSARAPLSPLSHARH